MTSLTVAIDRRLCFVLMPFRAELDPVYKTIQDALVLDNKLRCQRADDIYSAGIVIDEVWAKICESQMVLADASGRNGNVFYEMGLAHAIGKDIIILAQSMDDIPFDLRHRRVILYSLDHLNELRIKLARTVENLQWKAPRIRQWIWTDIEDVRVGLSSPVESTLVNATPIEAVGHIVGLPHNRLRYRIQGFVVTDREYAQATSWIDCDGYWKIDQIHLGARNHKLFFRIYDESHRLVAKTDSINVIREGSP